MVNMGSWKSQEPKLFRRKEKKREKGKRDRNREESSWASKGVQKFLIFNTVCDP